MFDMHKPLGIVDEKCGFVLLIDSESNFGWGVWGWSLTLFLLRQFDAVKHLIRTCLMWRKIFWNQILCVSERTVKSWCSHCCCFAAYWLILIANVFVIMVKVLEWNISDIRLFWFPWQTERSSVDVWAYLFKLEIQEDASGSLKVTLTFV